MSTLSMCYLRKARMNRGDSLVTNFKVQTFVRFPLFYILCCVCMLIRSKLKFVCLIIFLSSTHLDLLPKHIWQLVCNLCFNTLLLVSFKTKSCTLISKRIFRNPCKFLALHLEHIACKYTYGNAGGPIPLYQRWYRVLTFWNYIEYSLAVYAVLPPHSINRTYLLNTDPMRLIYLALGQHLMTPNKSKCNRFHVED